MRTPLGAIAFLDAQTDSLVDGTAGWCAYWCYQAYGAPRVLIPSFQTASDMWRYGVQHAGGDIPIGGIAYLGERPYSAGDPNWDAGDVMIHKGGGIFRASDYPRNGVFGDCTLQQREIETGRHYVGWLSDVVGNPIQFNTPIIPPNQTETSEQMGPRIFMYRDVNSPFYERLVVGTSVKYVSVSVADFKVIRGAEKITKQPTVLVQVSPADYSALIHQ